MGFSLRAVVFSVAIFVWTLDCAAVIGEQQRLKFMQAEEMIKSGDDQGFSILSLELVDYPLYFYLNYQWLSDNLDQDKKIQPLPVQHARIKWRINILQKLLDFLILI